METGHTGRGVQVLTASCNQDATLYGSKLLLGGKRKKTHISLFPLIHTYSISISVCIRVGDPFKVWLYVGSGAPGGRWRCTEGPQIGTLHCTVLHIVTLLLNVGAVAAEQYYMTRRSLHYDRVPCCPHSFRAYT